MSIKEFFKGLRMIINSAWESEGTWGKVCISVILLSLPFVVGLYGGYAALMQSCFLVMSLVAQFNIELLKTLTKALEGATILPQVSRGFSHGTPHTDAEGYEIYKKNLEKFYTDNQPPRGKTLKFGDDE